MNDDYPVQFSVEYGDGSRNRLTALFRWVLVLPVLVVYVLLTDPSYSESWVIGSVPYSSLLLIVLVLIILFRTKYPRWIFDFVLALTRFGARVIAYASLLVDEYPSIDEEQNVRLDIAYPDADAELNRFPPAGQVVSGDSPLHCPYSSGIVCGCGYPGCLDCDYYHRKIP